MATTLKTKKSAKKTSKTASKKTSKKATKAPPKKRLSAKQKLAREIKRRNKLFEDATVSEKRVLIAQDVIDQIKAKRLVANTGSWIALTSDRYEAIPSVYGAGESVRELFLSKKMEPCSCCALGGLFMSCTLYNNKTTTEEMDEASIELGEMLTFDGWDKPRNGLASIFSVEQLALIEMAFEGGYGFFNDNDNDMQNDVADVDAATEFHNAYRDDDGRLIAIMQNIVKNRGTFKPTLAKLPAPTTNNN